LPQILKYTEEELVALLKSNDKRAFEYLYDHYAAALYAVILKKIDDSALAEDILQEAFVKIWNHFSAYNASKGRLFTWMLNICRNLAIDTLRSKSFKNQSKIQRSEKAVDFISNNVNEKEKFDALGIRIHLDRLAHDQKQIVNMAYFEGFTQDEISKKLDIPLGTIKTKMRAAILALKKILQPYVE